MEGWGLEFRFVLYVVILPAVVVFGILGNSLSIVVLGRDNLQHSTAFFLRALAAADIAFLVLCIPCMTLSAILDVYFDSLKLAGQVRWFQFSIFINPVFHATQMASTWVLVLVTIERYILVCKPLRAIRYMSTPRMITAVALVWLGAGLFQAPLFFQTGCEVQHDNSSLSCADFNQESHDDNMTGSVTMTMNISNPLYHLIYRTLGYFLVRFVFPFVILIFLSCVLAKEIKSSRKRHSAIYSSVQTDQATQITRAQRGKYTRTVVTIATLFGVCLLPQAVFLLLLTLKRYKILKLPDDFVYAFDALASLLLTLNSSCNFIIYCVMREGFRMHLRRMFTGNQNNPL